MAALHRLAPHARCRKASAAARSGVKGRWRQGEAWPADRAPSSGRYGVLSGPSSTLPGEGPPRPSFHPGTVHLAAEAPRVARAAFCVQAGPAALPGRTRPGGVAPEASPTRAPPRARPQSLKFPLGLAEQGWCGLPPPPGPGSAPRRLRLWVSLPAPPPILPSLSPNDLGL